MTPARKLTGTGRPSFANSFSKSSLIASGAQAYFAASAIRIADRSTALHYRLARTTPWFSKKDTLRLSNILQNPAQYGLNLCWLCEARVAYVGVFRPTESVAQQIGQPEGKQRTVVYHCVRPAARSGGPCRTIDPERVGQAGATLRRMDPMTPDMRVAKEQRETAHHEAAHAVVNFWFDIPFRKVTIRPNEVTESFGHVARYRPSRWFEMPAGAGGRKTQAFAC